MFSWHLNFKFCKCAETKVIRTLDIIFVQRNIFPVIARLGAVLLKSLGLGRALHFYDYAPRPIKVHRTGVCIARSEMFKRCANLEYILLARVAADELIEEGLRSRPLSS